MVKDAESHAEDDKKKKALIESRNKADQMVYTTEKTLKDFGDKVSTDEKSKIEAAIAQVKSVQEGSDAKAIDDAVEELMKSSHKLAEEMYKQQAASSGAQQQAQPGAEQGAPSGESQGEGQAVDAEYEVVDDKDKK
jgi:molecular chaperone DnaK